MRDQRTNAVKPNGTISSWTTTTTARIRVLPLNFKFEREWYFIIPTLGIATGSIYMGPFLLALRGLVTGITAVFCDGRIINVCPLSSYHNHLTPVGLYTEQDRNMGSDHRWKHVKRKWTGNSEALITILGKDVWQLRREMNRWQVTTEMKCEMKGKQWKEIWRW